MVIYKSPTGGIYPGWCDGGPEGATYAATKNGWFNMEKHNQWFKQASVHPLLPIVPYLYHPRHNPTEEKFLLL
jgi:hypothetical protein